MAIPFERDFALVPYAQNWNTRAGVTPATFGLTQDQMDALSEVIAPYVAAVTAMLAQRADGTRSKSQTDARNQTRAAMLAVLRPLYANVQKNPAVTDANKTLLGVTILSSTTRPVPAPDEPPIVKAEAVAGRTVGVSIRGSTNKAKKPSGAVGAFVYSFVGSSYPSDPSLWAFCGQASKATFDVTFPDAVPAGAQVWISAAFVNRKGEAGPPSLPVTTHLQYAGVVAAEQKMKIAA